MTDVTIVSLAQATTETCGGKAASLGALLRAGLPVPDGFVVPFTALQAITQDLLSHNLDVLRRHLDDALSRLGGTAVAVRSSAAGEDTAEASAAGQYESVLAVHGTDDVLRAIGHCWESATAARVAHYRTRTSHRAVADRPRMAVLVQRLVDADISGVMFTPGEPGAPTRIEAGWGLGPSVVGGPVTPDSYTVAPDGTVCHTTGTKGSRMDRNTAGTGVVIRDVPEDERTARTLDDAAAVRLAALGRRGAELLGAPQDIEWAIVGRTIWLLQARPITAALPRVPDREPRSDVGVPSGIPGAHGVASGAARIVRSPSDFGRVRTGDILVCPYTDPAWTVLFTIAAGVVTQTGGALSHAAIVAREFGIPAVLAVPDATDLIADGARITIDGTTGTVVIH